MSIDENAIIFELQDSLRQKESIIAENQKVITAQVLRIKQLEQHLANHQNAFWWRATKPLRLLVNKVRIVSKSISKSLKKSTNKKCRNILFVMHVLDLYGAPIVLVDMVRIVLENGDNPVVLSSSDGPLKQEYLDMGISVIINDDFQFNPSEFECFARNFDMVVVNTLGSGRAILALNHSPIPVLWWIHEPSFFIPVHISDIPIELSENIHPYAVSEYCAKSLLSGGLVYDYKILAYGINDFADKALNPSAKENIVFLNIGGFHPSKGNDILLKAILAIDKKLLTNVRFIFIGRYTEPKAELDLELYAAAESNDFISCYEIMPREDLMKLYCEADGVIIPSREETVSAVAIEAAMFSKPSICSDRVGVAVDHIIANETGLIFPDGDYIALSNLIVFAIKNRDKMIEIGRNARTDVYEKIFTMEQYKKNVLTAIDEILAQ